jgi:hypothetical protein
VNFEDSSFSSVSRETPSFEKVGSSCSSSGEPVIVLEGAVTRSNGRFESLLEELLWVFRFCKERKGRGEKGLVKVEGVGVVVEREKAINGS